jgi:hypothetical protein
MYDRNTSLGSFVAERHKLSKRISQQLKYAIMDVIFQGSAYDEDEDDGRHQGVQCQTQ